MWGRSLRLDFRQSRHVFKAFEAYGSITSMALSPDGATLALGTNTGRIETFNWQTASRRAILADSGGPTATGLAFNRAGYRLAAAFFSGDGLVRV